MKHTLFYKILLGDVIILPSRCSSFFLGVHIISWVSIWISWILV